MRNLNWGSSRLMARSLDHGGVDNKKPRWFTRFRRNHGGSKGGKMSKRDDPQFKLRLPVELNDWIARQAEKNRSTKNSEIVRSIRERREREQREAA